MIYPPSLVHQLTCRSWVVVRGFAALRDYVLRRTMLTASIRGCTDGLATPNLQVSVLSPGAALTSGAARGVLEHATLATG
ncbi:MAG TPA: hypothetical protein DGG94_07410 [Micromonosporaceae bacterium]|nr:hypothetical protein [Micromonosporaceae bacterium]HCU49613.1 hypothetical protein [Micromonosporaceae bacterium]